MPVSWHAGLSDLKEIPHGQPKYLLKCLHYSRGESWLMMRSASAGNALMGGLTPFSKLTKASVEALRYRGEDVEKSLTKNAIKEASLLDRPLGAALVLMHALWRLLLSQLSSVHRLWLMPGLGHSSCSGLCVQSLMSTLWSGRREQRSRA